MESTTQSMSMVTPPPVAVACHPRDDGNEVWLRQGTVWCVYGSSGRQRDPVLHHDDRQCRGVGHYDHRANRQDAGPSITRLLVRRVDSDDRLLCSPQLAACYFNATDS